MRKLEGRPISSKILADLKEKIFKENARPALAVILIGSDNASRIYVDLKKKKAEEIGIIFSLYEFSEDSMEGEIIVKIRELNENGDVDGIIVQLPLPELFNTQKIIDTIDPRKDVDGFHPENFESFLHGSDILWPVFPKAILKTIESSGVDFAGSSAIAIVNSEKFGQVMKESFRRKGISGVYILSDDVDRENVRIKEADIVVSAVGNPGILKGDNFKNNAIVIDGGISTMNGRVLGDVDFKSAEDRDIFLSPVPGGVGPVTIACLLENVYIAYKNNLKR